jgi:hypothetical protein
MSVIVEEEERCRKEVAKLVIPLQEASWHLKGVRGQDNAVVIT